MSKIAYTILLLSSFGFLSVAKQSDQWCSAKIRCTLLDQGIKVYQGPAEPYKLGRSKWKIPNTPFVVYACKTATSTGKLNNRPGNGSFELATGCGGDFKMVILKKGSPKSRMTIYFNNVPELNLNCNIDFQAGEYHLEVRKTVFVEKGKKMQLITTDITPDSWTAQRIVPETETNNPNNP